MEKNLKVLLAQLKEDDLAKPINRSGFCQSNKEAGSSFRDNLALPPFLANLERNLQAETDMVIFDHPKAKYYSLQKARIKKKESMDSF